MASTFRSALPPFIHGGAPESQPLNALQQGIQPARGLPLHSNHDGLQTWRDIQPTSNSTPSSAPEQRAQGSDINTNVESHQRRQELAMQATFGGGAHGSMQGTSSTATFAGYSGPQQQGGSAQGYAMQSMPPQVVQNQVSHQVPSGSAANQLYASGSYQQQPQQQQPPQQFRQPHQVSDLYASQGSAPQQAHDLYSSQHSLPLAGQGIIQGGILNKHETDCSSPEGCLYLPSVYVYLTVRCLLFPQPRTRSRCSKRGISSTSRTTSRYARSDAGHCQGNSGQFYRDAVCGLQMRQTPLSAGYAYTDTRQSTPALQSTSSSGPFTH